MDTLDAGGAEQVAVNLVNLLPRDLYRTYLCTTRRDGVLADRVAPHVGRLRLARRHAFDLAALKALRRFVTRHQIQILHAHGTSIFFAAAAALVPPRPAVVWHDHFGRHEEEERPDWLYRLAALRVSAGSVKTHLSRGLASLRSRMGAELTLEGVAADG